MREIAVDFLRKEIVRLDGLVADTEMFHPSGEKLHSVGDVLTPVHAKVLSELRMTRVFLLEPGEDDRAAKESLAGEKIEPAKLSVGATLAQDVQAPTGELLAPGGTMIDALLLEKIQASKLIHVEVRRAGLQAEIEEVKEYLARNPVAPRGGSRPETQVTRLLRAGGAPLRPLLVPRARVLVALREEFSRALVTNTLTTAGHEATEFRTAADALLAVPHLKPDVIVTDLGEAATISPAIRNSVQVRIVMILVLLEEGKAAEVHRALQSGANETLSKPPRREPLLEKIRGCLGVRGRRVQMKPALDTERRSQERQPGHIGCAFKDPMLSKPLPIVSAEVLDIGEGGLAAEYNRPVWPHAWAYTPHGVHPKHFFYNYAKGNPLGRALVVTLPGPRGVPFEASARFVEVEPNRDYERVRLAFEKVSGSVAQHMTTVKRLA